MTAGDDLLNDEGKFSEDLADNAIATTVPLRLVMNGSHPEVQRRKESEFDISSLRLCALA